VVCDSDFLYQQKRAEHGNVVQIHQGVPEEFFRAKPPAADFRRLCYYGTWGVDLEPAFLAALCEAGFEVTVSGFLKGSPPPFPQGVRHLPPVRREDLVARLEGFDAFLLPYRINPFLMGVIPAKIYEILAMGRPVLATPLPSFAPLKSLVHVADAPADWVRIARALPRTETPALREERIALAREHTCAKEFQRFREAVRAVWGAAREAP
jgi:glycosyltransferase involved in cell wall biosynthesis